MLQNRKRNRPSSPHVRGHDSGEEEIEDAFEDRRTRRRDRSHASSSPGSRAISPPETDGLNSPSPSPPISQYKSLLNAALLPVVNISASWVARHTIQGTVTSQTKRLGHLCDRLPPAASNYARLPLRAFSNTSRVPGGEEYELESLAVIHQRFIFNSRSVHI